MLVTRRTIPCGQTAPPLAPSMATHRKSLRRLRRPTVGTPDCCRYGADRRVAETPKVCQLAHYLRCGMAYDEDIANRIRELLASQSGVSEQKMFGGLAFLIGGNMSVAASGQGGVLVRVDPAESDKLVETSNARLMEMRGKSMQGWLRVESVDVRTKRQLAKWVSVGTGYARSLPPKP